MRRLKTGSLTARRVKVIYSEKIGIPKKSENITEATREVNKKRKLVRRWIQQLQPKTEDKDKFPEAGKLKPDENPLNNKRCSENMRGTI